MAKQQKPQKPIPAGVTHSQLQRLADQARRAPYTMPELETPDLPAHFRGQPSWFER